MPARVGILALQGDFDAHATLLRELGALPIGSTPQQFDARIHADYDKWGPIIKAAGMQAE